MDIFKRKNKRELPPLLMGDDLEFTPAQPDYSAVLDWLVGLSDEDYVKVTKVAEIHRKAYQEAAGVLGDPNEPTSFIHPPEPLEAPTNFLDDDDDISSALIEDEPKKTKVKVKDAKDS